ncbi:TlpA family protein disulfide reductase [Lysobacter sp. A6]|uniref:TlpA family protein disulfide reductase n=2 Tax=Noviluteimonas lactosilytica TaxID=2888523 RepID=A0ABS8JFG6_9GAMM|nr:TlpA disulfide reductase family protein [Lysobacter lactosilyticus]MCC8362360.1 TlpA family protein disulfide reductase [Lysobacter lactosilyticus]
MAVAACKREPATPAPEATPAPAPAATAQAPASAATVARPSATKDVPSLSLATVDGKQFNLADHRGRWVVVNFWATWCGPCLKEMPALSALDTMREHIDVVGLAYEDTTPEEMQAFLIKHPVSYPIAMVDVYDPPKDFETPAGLPTTYLIGPDGRVAKRFIGPVEPHDIEKAIADAGGPKPKGA